jgi:gamma-glutamyltranspeptidase/glutathione hydrolase
VLSKVYKEKIPLNIQPSSYIEKDFKNGRDEFYKGETAKTLVRYLQKRSNNHDGRFGSV